MSEIGKDSTRIRKVIIQDYNLKQLAAIYDLSKYLFRRKLKSHKEQIGEPNGYEYDSKQVKLIFELIPLPSNVLVVTVRNHR